MPLASAAWRRCLPGLSLRAASGWWCCWRLGRKVRGGTGGGRRGEDCGCGRQWHAGHGGCAAYEERGYDGAPAGGLTGSGGQADSAGRPDRRRRQRGRAGPAPRARRAGARGAPARLVRRMAGRGGEPRWGQERGRRTAGRGGATGAAGSGRRRDGAGGRAGTTRVGRNGGRGRDGRKVEPGRLLGRPDGSDSNPGTQASPVQDDHRGASARQRRRDDPAAVRDQHAESTNTLSKSGTAAAPIRIQAVAGGTRPVLDFSAQPSRLELRGLNFTGDYWIVRGFEIQRAATTASRSAARTTRSICS